MPAKMIDCKEYSILVNLYSPKSSSLTAFSPLSLSLSLVCWYFFYVEMMLIETFLHL